MCLIAFLPAILFVLLLAVPAVHAQTPAPAAPVWATVTPESSNVSVTLPAGATYRLGDYAHNKWSQSDYGNADYDAEPDIDGRREFVSVQRS